MWSADPDRLLVVLDHDDRVAQVAQADQGLDEPPVVPLVQADRRLVEDVEHPDQSGADLGGEPDPLGLAAGEGGGAARQGQVVEARRRGGTLSRARDLLEHRRGDACDLPLVQVEAVEEVVGLGAATGTTARGCCSPPTVTASASRVQPRSAARLARARAACTARSISRALSVGPLVAAGQPGDQALVRGLVLALAAEAVGVGDGDRGLPPVPSSTTGAAFLDSSRKGVSIENPYCRGHTLEHPVVVGRRGCRPTTADRALGQRSLLVGDGRAANPPGSASRSPCTSGRRRRGC